MENFFVSELPQFPVLDAGAVFSSLAKQLVSGLSINNLACVGLQRQVNVDFQHWNVVK